MAVCPKWGRVSHATPRRVEFALVERLSVNLLVSGQITVVAGINEPVVAFSQHEHLNPGELWRGWASHDWVDIIA